MARIVLLEALPWRVADGVAEAARLAGGGSRNYDHRGYKDWRSGVVTDPRFTAGIGFGEDGWSGSAVPTAAAITFAPSDPVLMTKLVKDYMWIGAPIEIRSGDDALASPTYLMELTGTVAGVSANAGQIVLTVADLAAKLNRPIVTARFAGTGGIEGGTEAEGRTKRRSWGSCRNVEGFVLDKANNIYEFGDPAFPLDDFDNVSDKGRAVSCPDVTWQGSIAATFAALQASTPERGAGVTAPSIACVKWWTTPAGPLTADLKGEVGTGYTNLPASIAARVSAAVGGPAFETSSFNTVNAARNIVTGVHISDDVETAAQALDRLLLPLFVGWTITPAGEVRLAEFKLTSPVETLAIKDVARIESFRPASTVKLAFQRNHRIHSAAEISAAVSYSDIIGAPTISPEAFGAKFDVNYNDSAALLAAIAEANSMGGYVLIPTGKTLWTDGFVLPNQASIIGGDRFTSKIKLRPGANPTSRVLDGRTGGAKKITLRNMTVDASKSVTLDNTVAVELWNAECDLRDLEITGGAIEGVYLYLSRINSSGLHCYENGFPGVDASGMHIDSCAGFSVNGLVSHNNGFHGLILTGASDGTIQAVLYDNEIDGVRVQYNSNNVHFDIVSRGNGLRGIYFTTGSMNCAVAGTLADCTNGLATNEATNILCSARSSGHAEWDIYLVAAGDSVTWTGSPAAPLVMNEGPGTVNLAGSSAVKVTMPALAEVTTDYLGSPLSNELPRYITARVSLGENIVTTDDNVSYTMQLTNLTGILDNADGSPRKGTARVTGMTANEGYLDISVLVNGLLQPSTRTVFKKVVAGQPNFGGPGHKGATDTALNSTDSSSQVQISDVLTVEVASGETLRASASLDYYVEGEVGDGRTVIAQWKWKPYGAGSWTANMDTEVSGSEGVAGYFADGEWFESVPGHIDVNQDEGLSPGVYSGALFARLDNSGLDVTFDGAVHLEARA